MDHVVLVDHDDREIGTMDKMEAHVTGTLHRAFSILVFNSRGEILIQQRAADKYHSAGLWTNTCCSHPRPNETIRQAGARRLREEMGIHAEPDFLYKFVYRAPLDNGLVEHELDHVLRATFDGTPVSNPAEVQAWKYVPIPELLADVSAHPEKYTCWFLMILQHQYPAPH